MLFSFGHVLLQMVSGAASCFYAFVGFDVITTSGEESSKPTKHVPIAIVSTLVICLVAYVGVSAVLTLILPWNKLTYSAALPNAFAQVPLGFFYKETEASFCFYGGSTNGCKSQ